MKNRRGFLLTLTAGIVALGVIIAPAIADELIGAIIKVDVEGKKLTVEDKEGKETVVTTTDETEVVSKKGTAKIDLEKISKTVARIQEKGKKGMNVKITHEKGVASKIEPAGKKKAN